MRNNHFRNRKTPVVCYDCYKKSEKVNEKNQIMKERPLTCSTCQCDFGFDPTGHISEKMRQSHLGNRKSPVVCYECHEKQPMYTCSRCGVTGIRDAFQKTNYEGDCKHGKQQCLECKSGTRKGKVCIVEQCKKFILRENLSQHHQTHPNNPLVWEVCTGKGYTPANTQTYTCASCKEVTGGHGLFQTKNFQQAAKRGTQKCKSCFR